jgi:hypothetical protein
MSDSNLRFQKERRLSRQFQTPVSLKCKSSCNRIVKEPDPSVRLFYFKSQNMFAVLQIYGRIRIN